MEARRRLREEGVRGRAISHISKMIQRAIRSKERKKQDDKIGVLLEQFSGLKHIAGMRAGGKKRQMSAIRWPDGSEASDKKDIANVFAAFYEGLYRSRWADTEGNATMEEKEEAIKRRRLQRSRRRR